MHEVGADQQVLLPGEGRMFGNGFFHLIGTRIEYLEEISVAALEVLENFRELAGNRIRVERQDTINDVIRACLISRVQIPGFGRRFERTDHHSRRIRAKIKTLALQ